MTKEDYLFVTECAKTFGIPISRVIAEMKYVSPRPLTNKEKDHALTLTPTSKQGG